MKKSLEKLIKRMEDGFPGLIYYTDNPINLDNKYFGQKYFIVFQNTHKIYQSFRTLSELEDGIKDIMSEGIHQDSMSWKYQGEE